MVFWYYFFKKRIFQNHTEIFTDEKLNQKKSKDSNQNNRNALYSFQNYKQREDTGGGE